ITAGSGTTSGSWSWSESAPLSDGLHTVSITVTNADGTSGFSTFSFTPTDVAPTVTVSTSPTSPPENTDVSATGTFSDYDDGVSIISASEGTAIITAGSGTTSGSWSWSESAPLSDGLHTVSITVTNADGTSGFSTFSF